MRKMLCLFFLCACLIAGSSLYAGIPSTIAEAEATPSVVSDFLLCNQIYPLEDWNKAKEVSDEEAFQFRRNLLLGVSTLNHANDYENIEVNNVIVDEANGYISLELYGYLGGQGFPQDLSRSNYYLTFVYYTYPDGRHIPALQIVATGKFRYSQYWAFFKKTGKTWVKFSDKDILVLPGRELVKTIISDSSYRILSKRWEKDPRDHALTWELELPRQGTTLKWHAHIDSDIENLPGDKFEKMASEANQALQQFTFESAWDKPNTHFKPIVPVKKK